MEIITDEEVKNEVVLDVARKMTAAALTAPKARGKNYIVSAIVTGEGIKKISEVLFELAENENAPAFFKRDAENILSAQAMVILGTRIQSMGLSPCGMCGAKNCAEKDKNPNQPCVFNTGDLGIAVGSAVSVAMDNRIDNRIMYTVGQAILKMKLLGDDIKIAYGIPLSISAKNPFFDRK